MADNDKLCSYLLSVSCSHAFEKPSLELWNVASVGFFSLPLAQAFGCLGLRVYLIFESALSTPLSSFLYTSRQHRISHWWESLTTAVR